ncbi:DNA-directed RNA polymerase subunit beta', partial [Halomonas sp. MG34]|nr:DNA-directed RNA polymerase subunit beta' [Halomonas sp. MG34]
VYGTVQEVKEVKDKQEIIVQSDVEQRAYAVPYNARMKVSVGDTVIAGQELTEGSVDPKDLLRVQGVEGVQDYLLREVQRVYRMQGVEIGDKHVEVMVRQMLRKIRVIDSGDTKVLPGSLLELHQFRDANHTVLNEGAQPATGKPVLLGITKASLETDSFLSAASFQETTRVLTDAAIKGKRDELLGLKENVIIGKLVPAGTGMQKYRKVKASLDDLADTTEETEETETIQ